MGLWSPPWARLHPPRTEAPGEPWLLARGYYQTHLPTRDPRPRGDTESCLPWRGCSAVSVGKGHWLGVTCVLEKPFQRPPLVRPPRQLSCRVGLTGYVTHALSGVFPGSGTAGGSIYRRQLRVSAPTVTVTTAAPDGGAQRAQVRPGRPCALPSCSPASGCRNLGRFLPSSSHL